MFFINGSHCITCCAVLAEVVAAVTQWRAVATAAEVGLSSAELADFAPAFEHVGLDEARALLA